MAETAPLNTILSVADLSPGYDLQYGLEHGFLIVCRVTYHWNVHCK